MSEASFDALLACAEPVLALAPMQDVTNLAFMDLMTRYGGADIYFTEYFRVHADSHLSKFILSSITQNPTGRPVVAQMIGNDIPSLVRTARELLLHPVAAIDLNLGCPAPVVYKKCAGGGLLRDLPKVDAILGALRDAVPGRFTVKTRIGFDDERTFEALLPIFAKHSLDLLTVHGRTVTQMYREGVHYDLIAQAVAALKCPVLANGNVSSAAAGIQILRDTGARGLMIGRGVIRNPWMFAQIRNLRRGEPIFTPTGRDVKKYIFDLYEAVHGPDMRETPHINRIKKFLNFIGEGVEPTGAFLHAVRRMTSDPEFQRICDEYLDHDRPMPLEPFASKGALPAKSGTLRSFTTPEAHSDSSAPPEDRPEVNRPDQSPRYQIPHPPGDAQAQESLAAAPLP
jgi:tRNA-dihydrouridine synthase